MRPAPWSNALTPGVGLAVVASTDLSCAGVHSGCCCLSNAAAPATCGVAMDVPLNATCSPFVPAAAATMPTPGAVTSGLRPLSPMRGPLLEKYASESSRSTAPTDSAASAVLGELTVPVPPALPAAMTNNVPYWAVRSLTACSSGSISSVSPPPRLMLTIWAPCSAAQRMPSRIQDSWQPFSTQTLASISCAPGATPPYFESWLATVEPTCVPWPTWSVLSGSVVKFFSAIC